MHQVASAEEEIDWTHFTFQHGFRQLPQQLLQQVHHPVTSAFPEADVKMSEASQSPSPSPLDHLSVATQQSADIKSDSDAVPAPSAAAPGLKVKDKLTQHAQQDSPAALMKQEEAEHAALKAEDAPEMGEEGGMAAEGEGGLTRAGEEGQGSDGEIGAEGQRLTRSRRGHAAGLYMLDHGSQLIPKKASTPLASLG